MPCSGKGKADGDEDEDEEDELVGEAGCSLMPVVSLEYKWGFART